MRSVFLFKVLRHILQNKYKYIALSFSFLVGCMSGYYTMDALSYSLSSTIKGNLELRFFSPGSDITAVFLSVLFSGIVWLCGYSPAGIVILPFLALCNAAVQVFIFRIALLDVGLLGGLLAVLNVMLLFFWSAFCLYLSEISMESSITLLRSGNMRLSLVEKAGIINKKARVFCILSFLYVLSSYLIFLLNRAIF